MIKLMIIMVRLDEGAVEIPLWQGVIHHSLNSLIPSED